MDLGHDVVLEHALGTHDTHLGILGREGGEEGRGLHILNLQSERWDQLALPILSCFPPPRHLL